MPRQAARTLCLLLALSTWLSASASNRAFGSTLMRRCMLGEAMSPESPNGPTVGARRQEEVLALLERARAADAASPPADELADLEALTASLIGFLQEMEANHPFRRDDERGAWDGSPDFDSFSWQNRRVSIIPSQEDFELAKGSLDASPGRIRAFLERLTANELTLLRDHFLNMSGVPETKTAPLKLARRLYTEKGSLGVGKGDLKWLKEEFLEKVRAAFTGDQETAFDGAFADFGQIERELRELAEIPRFRERLRAVEFDDPRLKHILERHYLAREGERMSLYTLSAKFSEARTSGKQMNDRAIELLKRRVLRRIRVELPDLFDEPSDSSSPALLPLAGARNRLLALRKALEPGDRDILEAILQGRIPPTRGALAARIVQAAHHQAGTSLAPETGLLLADEFIERIGAGLSGERGSAIAAVKDSPGQIAVALQKASPDSEEQKRLLMTAFGRTEPKKALWSLLLSETSEDPAFQAAREAISKKEGAEVSPETLDVLRRLGLMRIRGRHRALFERPPRPPASKESASSAKAAPALTPPPPLAALQGVLSEQEVARFKAERLERFIQGLSPPERYLMEHAFLSDPPQRTWELARALGELIQPGKGPLHSVPLNELKNALRDRIQAAAQGDSESAFAAAFADLGEIEAMVRQLGRDPEGARKLRSFDPGDARLRAILEHDLLAEAAPSAVQLARALPRERIVGPSTSRHTARILKNRLLRRIRSERRELFGAPPLAHSPASKAEEAAPDAPAASATRAFQKSEFESFTPEKLESFKGERLEEFTKRLDANERYLMTHFFLAETPQKVRDIARNLVAPKNPEKKGVPAYVAQAIRSALEDKIRAASTGSSDSALAAAFASFEQIELDLRRLARDPAVAQRLRETELGDPRLKYILENDLLADRPATLNRLRTGLSKGRVGGPEMTTHTVKMLKNHLLRRLRSDFRDLFPAPRP